MTTDDGDGHWLQLTWVLPAGANKVEQFRFICNVDVGRYRLVEHYKFQEIFRIRPEEDEPHPFKEYRWVIRVGLAKPYLEYPEELRIELEMFAQIHDGAMSWNDQD
jgi:hypothetical protein